MKFFYLSFIWVLFLISSWLIGISCSYSSTSGPFNFSFTHIISLLGFGLALFSLFLLKQTEKVYKFKAIHQLIFAITIAIYSIYISKHTHNKVQKAMYGEDSPVNNEISVFISIFSFISITVLAIYNFTKKHSNSFIKSE